MCGVFSTPKTNSPTLQTQLDIVQLSLILTLSVVSFRPHRLMAQSPRLHPHQMPPANTGLLVLLTNLAINQGFPWSLCMFDNLLECLVAFRKTPYFHFLVYYKGYKWIAKWRSMWGKVRQRAWCFHAFHVHTTLPAPSCVKQPGSPQNSAI